MFFGCKIRKIDNSDKIDNVDNIGNIEKIDNSDKIDKIDKIYKYFDYVPADGEWKSTEIKIPDLFRLHYNIHERQFLPYEVESKDDNFFIKSGPPFSFQIILRDVNLNVNFVQFKKCLLINSIENNLLEIDDISIYYEILFPDKIYNEIIGTLEKEDDYNLFYTDGVFYNSNKINELIIKQEDVGFDDIFRRGSSIVFGNIPIDYLNDESVTIKVEIIVTMGDGEEINIQIDEEYIRKVYEKNY